VHEDCADRRDEGHDRGRQTHPGDPPAGRQRLLHPCNTFFKRFCGAPLRSCGPLPRAITACYFELPVARRLSSAVRAVSPARTRRFDYDQAQLGTRSAIFAVGQHFVQGAPFAILSVTCRACRSNPNLITSGLAFTSPSVAWFRLDFIQPTRSSGCCCLSAHII
jgi:hypothetical protein